MSKKPKASLRRPDPAVAAFVEGTPTPKRRQTSDVRRQSEGDAQTPTRWRRTVEVKADGTKQKRLTVRLPEPLAAQLAKHCDEQDRSMSDVIAELVTRELAARS